MICRQIFPDFMRICETHMQGEEQFTSMIGEFETFSQACLEADGENIIAYVLDLLTKGCVM